jgi:hypothetical protein
MKRMNLFEFEDYPWFPDLLRQYLTLYIVTFHRLIGTRKAMAPLLEKVMQKTKQDSIVDICSGGGGPMIDMAQSLKRPDGQPVSITLTDLYPNKKASEAIKALNIKNLTYYEKSVNAADVPSELTGIRTMVASFHHMPPNVAESIVKDAFTKRKPLVIFEISDNSAPNIGWWLPMPVAFILVLLLTPFIRPLSLGQLFWTYIIPVMPLVIAWDGVSSNARTYSKEDLEEFTRKLTSDTYQWEIGRIRTPLYPASMLYLLGTPTN